jgi:hypothetical protein
MILLTMLYVMEARPPRTAFEKAREGAKKKLFVFPTPQTVRKRDCVRYEASVYLNGLQETPCSV